MKRSISCFLFLSCLMFLTPLYAGTQTLTTVYPSPNGDYLELTLSPSPAGTNCPVIPANGNVVLVNVNGTFGICDSTTSGVTPFSLTKYELWVDNVVVAGGVSYHYIYPGGGAAQGVSIGSTAQPPGAGPPWTNILYVNGAANITGTTTLGTSGGATSAAITGATYTVGGVTSNNLLQINATPASQALPAIAPTLNTNVPGIKVCNSTGANCGYLMLYQGTDNNFYPVYGP